VDNHVLRLRQKLEPDPANPRYFLTMHGSGYKFTPTDSGLTSEKVMPPAWRLMARLRLRTQLLVGTLLIICALLASLLVIVRHIVRAEIADGVQQSTDASLHAFENVQHERDLELSRTAALMAEVPPLIAVLTTQHATHDSRRLGTFLEAGR